MRFMRLLSLGYYGIMGGCMWCNILYLRDLHAFKFSRLVNITYVLFHNSVDMAQNLCRGIGQTWYGIYNVQAPVEI